MKRLLLPPLLVFTSILLSQSNAEGLPLEFDRTNENYKELGIPYMQNYGPSDYQTARPDNQTVLQGDNGLVYVGNSKGVLEFDGVNWRLIQLPNKSLIRTLAKNKKGKIFVGGFNELGYLKPDSLGFTTFQSIKSSLDSVYRNFNYLHQSFTIDDQVYFQSKDHLFRWADGAFKIWSPKNEIIYSAVVDGSVYLQEKGRGLFKLEGNRFELLAPFDHMIRAMLPYGEKILVGTRDNGLFLLEGDQWVPFRTSAESYLRKNTIMQCMLMPNGWITIGTGYGGLVVLDNQGALVNLFDKTKGLLNNSVLGQALDNQGGLWLGLDYGISRLELLSPYSIFDERMGVTGFVNTITRYQGDLFAGSISGLLRLKVDAPNFEKSFEKIPGAGPSFYLLEIDGELFIATRNGTFNYNGAQIKELSKKRSGALLHSKKDRTILYAGLFDGMAVFRKENGTWKDLGKIEGIEDDIRELVELDDGKLWMESQIDGVWLVDFYVGDTLQLAQPTVKRFLANKELPPGWLFLHYMRGEALFEIGGTVYKYDTQRDSIIEDGSFGAPFGFEGDIVPKLEDERGNLWMSAELPGLEDGEKQRTVSIPQNDGSYKVAHINDNRITHGVKKALYPERSGILWYGGPDGIIRQDLKQNRPPDRKL